MSIRVQPVVSQQQENRVGVVAEGRRFPLLASPYGLPDEAACNVEVLVHFCKELPLVRVERGVANVRKLVASRPVLDSLYFCLAQVIHRKDGKRVGPIPRVS